MDENTQVIGSSDVPTAILHCVDPSQRVAMPKRKTLIDSQEYSQPAPETSHSEERKVVL